MLPRTLHIGEKIYACEPHGDYGIGIIVSIDNKKEDYQFKQNELDVSVNLQLLTDYGDCKPDDIITCNNQEIYQIVPNAVDKRMGSPVCYECHRDEMEDDYPYYSPILQENLFNFEIKTNS